MHRLSQQPRLPLVVTVVLLACFFGATALLATATQAHPQAPAPQAVPLAPGDLDPTFGVGGVVTTTFGPVTATSNYGRGVVVRADGSIIVAGLTADFGSGGGDV